MYIGNPGLLNASPGLLWSVASIGKALSDVDADCTFDPANDTVTVDVNSSADPYGERIILSESNQAGVFIGTFGFEPLPTAENEKICAERYVIEFDFENDVSNSERKRIPTKVSW